MKAANAGCHLFIEKPVSDSMEGIDKLISIVDQHALVAFVAYQFRFHPGHQYVKNMLDAGHLGQLCAAHIVNGEYLPSWHPYEDYRETHPARRDLGGGSLRIQTHEIDYALWLFGIPQRVFAVGGHLSRLEVDVEDSVSLLLACEQSNRTFPVHIHLDYVQLPPQRVCEIVGDAGKLRYDYYAGEVKYRNTQTRQTDVFEFGHYDRNTMFMDELRHFLACVRGEEQPLIDLREGVKSMRIALMAAQSIEARQVISADARH
jgi:predicted dehydrogenase